MPILPTVIPTKLVGPIKITGSMVNAAVKVPLATFEKPLWLSVNRGAKISRLTQGILTTVVSDSMTRSCILEAPNAEYAAKIITKLTTQRPELIAIASTTSKHLHLQDWNTQIVGNLLYIRFAFHTGNASGHNMATKATEAIINWLLSNYPKLTYVSISGNYCTDKKVSAVNGILGRGKHVVSEIIIPRSICTQHLRSSPEQIVNLNIKKNLLGSILAGSTRSANAHFANMLLAIYLATGQDAANIVEGSQGLVHAELRHDDLYFTVTLPNIIVGTVGNGKDLAFARNNLELTGCLNSTNTEHNAKCLAAIIAATVLCGELSLLAAQTNQGELMRSHLAIER